MVAHAKKVKITALEYLELERSAEEKSEYYDGRIVAMAGSSLEHDFATVDIVTSLNSQLRGKQCKVLSGNMRVSTPECNCYFYPDVSVGYSDLEIERIAGVQSLMNPTLIVEVLSMSTEKMDREHKFFCYQTLPSLSTYILVAQDEPLVQVFERQPSGKWEYSHYQGLDVIVPLPSVGCELLLADVYARIEFKADNENIAMRILEQRARYNEYSEIGERLIEAERPIGSQA